MTKASDELGNDDVAAVTYRELFGYLEQRLAAGEQCDHTLRWTQEFADSHGLFFGELSQIFEGLGSHCDCEVLLNAAPKIPPQDPIGQESFKTPRQIAIDQGLFCHCRVDGKPVPYPEAVAAAEAGASVELHVPCAKDDSYAMPDLNRALMAIHAQSHQPEQDQGADANGMKTAELLLPYMEPAEDFHHCLNDSPSDLDALTALAGDMDRAAEILRAVKDAIAGHEARVWTEPDAILVRGPAALIDELIGNGHLEKWPREEAADEPTSQHKTVHVQEASLDAEIDEEIAPLIRELWKARFLTMMSCQNSPEGWVWIQFPLVVFAEGFLARIEEESDIPSLWQRWDFAIYPVTQPAVLFHDFPAELMPEGPSLRFAVSVRFPKVDLPAVLKTMVKHNEKNENKLESE